MQDPGPWTAARLWFRSSVDESRLMVGESSAGNWSGRHRSQRCRIGPVRHRSESRWQLAPVAVAFLIYDALRPTGVVLRYQTCSGDSL